MADSIDIEPETTFDAANYSIRAVQRVCDLLDLLQREPDGISLVHAAEVTGLPKSSAFRYLATLETRRYVERDPGTGHFRLGLALLPLQARQVDVVRQRARPYLETLGRELGESANFGMLEGHRVTYVEIVESAHTMRLAARPGDRAPIHSTALGKAIAAKLPEDRVRAILRAEGMARLTDRTITTQRAFLTQLEQVRDAGYALDEGESEVGGRCVAVAIPDVSLPVAISVSGPAVRFTRDHVAPAVARLRVLAARLGADLAGARDLD